MQISPAMPHAFPVTTDKVTLPLTLSGILQAANRLSGVSVRTPLLNMPLLDEQLGGRLFIKPETLQKTGSFKFRGAYNAIAQLSEADRQRGILAFSSGNHGQGVAAAARMLGTQATIIMPVDAPAMKLTNARDWGAEVITYDRPGGEQREDIANRIIAERNPVLVRPYDDWQVMAGQGTIGLEIIEQLSELGLSPDVIVAPCGGGGLLAGVSTAVQSLKPGTEVYGVEPEGFDDLARSLETGERQKNSQLVGSVCDSIMTLETGELTWPVLRQRLTGGLAVSDQEVMQAMAMAFRHFKLVIEPGGVVALAAMLSRKLDLAGRTVVAICSGGNVDPAMFAQALSQAE